MKTVDVKTHDNSVNVNAFSNSADVSLIPVETILLGYGGMEYGFMGSLQRIERVKPIDDD